jgi:hypothetical protein
MDRGMDIGIYYVSDVILQTGWIEEKGEGAVSSLVLTVIPYCISENMTGTEQN